MADSVLPSSLWGKSSIARTPDLSSSLVGRCGQAQNRGAQRITKTYYSLGGQMTELRVISATGNVLYYLHGDHLGSVSLVTCGNTGGCNGTPYQGAAARQMYSPYGAVRWSQGAPPTDIGFTGQRADATGLMFYQARYYSAALGRFLSADTIILHSRNYPASGETGSAKRNGYCYRSAPSLVRTAISAH